MGYVLITISAVLSVVAYRQWTKVLTPWLMRRQRSDDLADAVVAEWPGLVALVLPRTLRRGWNLLVLWVCVLLIGTPHHLVIWNFFRPRHVEPALFLHYLWSLAFWLALLALPALAFASHRLNCEREQSGVRS